MIQKLIEKRDRQLQQKKDKDKKDKQKGTIKVIKMIEKIIRKGRFPLPDWNPNYLGGFDLSNLPKFSLKKVQEKFPDLNLSWNSNETSSDEYSLDIYLKRV